MPSEDQRLEIGVADVVVFVMASIILVLALVFAKLSRPPRVWEENGG